MKKRPNDKMKLLLGINYRGAEIAPAKTSVENGKNEKVESDMKNDMIESIMDSYMRRGLLRIVFSESIDTPERRVNLIDMKAVFVVPCRIAEDKKSGNQAKKPFGTQRNLSMAYGRRRRGRYGQRVLRSDKRGGMTKWKRNI